MVESLFEQVMPWPRLVNSPGFMIQMFGRGFLERQEKTVRNFLYSISRVPDWMWKVRGTVLKTLRLCRRQYQRKQQNIAFLLPRKPLFGRWLWMVSLEFGQSFFMCLLSRRCFVSKEIVLSIFWSWWRYFLKIMKSFQLRSFRRGQEGQNCLAPLPVELRSGRVICLIS